MPETIFHSVAAKAEQTPSAVAIDAPGRLARRALGQQTHGVAGGTNSYSDSPNGLIQSKLRVEPP